MDVETAIEGAWIRATVANKKARPVALHFRVSVKTPEGEGSAPLFVLERRVEGVIETLAESEDEAEFKQRIREYANSAKVKKLLIQSLKEQADL